MAKKTATDFTEYNFETNPNHYTYEEITTIRRMMAAGQPIYLAPIKVEHREQLTETLCSTYNDCRTWHIGAETVTVRLTPASAEIYDMLVNDLRTEHRDGVRKSRCKVPGKRGGMVRCDERNSCKDCPYGLKPENREYQEISWEVQCETGIEPTAYDTTAEPVFAKMEYEAVRRKMADADPRCITAFEMDEAGYTIEEIMAELELSQRRVYQLIKIAKEAARKD